MGINILKAFLQLPSAFGFAKKAPKLAQGLTARLILLPNSHCKRKITVENRHQPTPIRSSRGRLRSQNIWAEVLSG
jgi:hypothetical protein